MAFARAPSVLVLALAYLAGCGADQPASDPAGAGMSSGGATAGNPTTGGNSSSSGNSAGGASGGSINQAGDGGMAGGLSQGGGGQAPTGPTFPKLLADCDTEAAHQHADTALAALLTGFWSGPEQYLTATSPSSGALTGYWTYAQAFDALLDGVERTGGERYQGLIRSFYDGRGARGWLVDYYDDETWMTLALMRAFDLTGDPEYLERAKTLFADIMAAWDTTCCGDYPGGIWWNKQHTQKATASNAGPVIAGVRLSERTNDASYLEFARKAYAFWMTNMVNPQNYAIYDHLSSDGTRAPGALTYNHGLMIGAALELHAATGEAHFLEEARGFGHYMVTVGTKSSEVGPLLHDALGQSCDGDCPAWKGIGYRYLVDLFEQEPRDEYRDVLEAGAKGIWTLARSADTNFFATNWAGPAPAEGGIEEQASAVMALNLYAMLCGSAKTTGATSGRYEAEEATVQGVALEAKYADFSGFGYVAAFSKTKQSIRFDVTTTKAGSHSITFKYSAAAGDAARKVAIGDRSFVQAFAGTGGWEQWAQVTFPADLPAGTTPVVLSFEADSTAPLNIDYLTVE